MRRTITGFTIWQGMCGNGITIGLVAVGIRRLGRQMRTLGVLHLAPTACFAAAVGAATLGSRVAPIAAAVVYGRGEFGSDDIAAVARIVAAFSPLVFIVIGILFGIVIFIGALVLQIIAAVSASSGQPYRYPMTIRFIK